MPYLLDLLNIRYSEISIILFPDKSSVIQTNYTCHYNFEKIMMVLLCIYSPYS